MATSLIVLFTLTFSPAWSVLAVTTSPPGSGLKLNQWLANAGLPELHQLLLSEGIREPQDLLLLNDADLADFARRHSLRLGARAALRLAIQNEAGMRSDAPEYSNVLEPPPAPPENFVGEEPLLVGKVDAPLEALAGCFGSAGCRVELDACLTSPQCESKAAASAVSIGAPSFEAFASKEALVGAVTAMALPLSLTPGGAALATCVMAKTDALTTCMAASAPHMQPPRATQAQPSVIEV